MWHGVFRQRLGRRLLRAVETGEIAIPADQMEPLTHLVPSESLRVSGTVKDYDLSIRDILRMAESLEKLEELYQESIHVPMSRSSRKKIREVYLTRHRQLRTSGLASVTLS